LLPEVRGDASAAGLLAGWAESIVAGGSNNPEGVRVFFSLLDPGVCTAFGEAF